MIGGNHLQVIVFQSRPQFFLMPFFAQRRSEDILGAFEAGRVHVFERKVKILRTGLGVDRQAAIAGLANFFQRVVAAEVHDIDGGIGHLGQGDGARSSLGLGRGRAREGVILGTGLAFGQCLLDDHVDGAAVFGMHADHRAGLGRGAHGFEDAGVVEHEDARVSHEELEAGDAFAHQLRHFGELGVGKVGDDAVKSVIGHRFRRRFLHPGVEGGAQRLSFVLNGEVDQGRGAAESGGASAGFKVIGAGSAAKWHIQMGVDVDPAREHVLARRIDQACGIFARQAGAHGNHAATFDRDVSLICVGCGNHGAVCNDGVEPHWPIPRAAEPVCPGGSVMYSILQSWGFVLRTGTDDGAQIGDT